MSKKKKKGGFLKFLAGVGIGVGAGVLLAPKEGSETRKELKAKIDELLENLKNIDKEEVKENIQNKITEIQETIKDLDKEKVAKIAKDKAKELKKKSEELLKYAKEKGTPALQKLASDTKDKAIEVAKQVIAKLEEK